MLIIIINLSRPSTFSSLSPVQFLGSSRAGRPDTALPGSATLRDCSTSPRSIAEGGVTALAAGRHTPMRSGGGGPCSDQPTRLLSLLVLGNLARPVVWVEPLDQQPDRPGAARAVLGMVAVVVDLGDAAVGAVAAEEIVAAEGDGAATVAVGGDVGAEFDQSGVERMMRAGWRSGILWVPSEEAVRARCDPPRAAPEHTKPH